jgi:pre-mRNA-splicing factor ATP-dependent RNA helicase DHX15/PRP43
MYFSHQLFTCPTDKGDRNWARNNYLSACALAQAENVRQQLERIMERYKVALLSTTDEGKRSINIRKALCCGFFMQVAHKVGERGSYETVKDNQVCCTSFFHPADS